LVNNTGQAVCVVCVQGWENRDPIEIAGLLVHEAVHVWQEHAYSIGEDTPGSEQEAYAIQAVAQELLAEFARRQA
jgi:predicted Zn-dependent protease